MSLPHLGLGLFLITSIFYVLPSGLPQPADFLLIMTIASGMALWQVIPRAFCLYSILTLFCLWIIAVNTVWFGRYGDGEFLVYTAFYLYNVVVFVFVIAAGYRNLGALNAVVRWGCVTALFFQFAYLLLVPSTTEAGLRSIGTFNNPNQLGYWALLAMTLLAVSRNRRPLELIDLAAIAAGIYAIMMSMSKAGMAAGVVLIVLILAFQRVRLIPALALVGLAVTVVSVDTLHSGGLFEEVAKWELLDKIERRVNPPQASGVQADDDIMKRGYALILDRSEYWLFGAGEGHFLERFNPPAISNEIHSMLGNLVFSYGLVGLGLFAVVLCLVFVRAPLVYQAYFIPLLMYGIVHMGLRVSEFWIFLALVYAQSRWDTKEEVEHVATRITEPARIDRFASVQRRPIFGPSDPVDLGPDLPEPRADHHGQRVNGRDGSNRPTLSRFGSSRTVREATIQQGGFTQL